MNQSAPLVSVVIPMFNVEKYIDEAIRSVLSQTLDDFEVICVDDGCTDSTVCRIQRFKDKRVRIIRQKHMGLSGARNTGFTAAKGKYIAMLNPDDVWLPNKLLMHVVHLDANPRVGVSFCPSLFIDDNSQLIGLGQYPRLKRISSAHIFCRNPVGNGSAAVIRRDALRDVACYRKVNNKSRYLFFDEALKQAEDIEFWLRLSLQTNWKFEGIRTPLTLYRTKASGRPLSLKKQLESWQLAVNRNREHYPEFFSKWYKRAKAYQYRYLARRAINKGRALTSIVFMSKALFTDIRILVEEPKRTLVTSACALLALLPTPIYRSLEQLSIKVVSPP